MRAEQRKRQFHSLGVDSKAILMMNKTVLSIRLEEAERKLSD